MSKTLKAIMDHWNGELPAQEGFIDLPFNLEAFCREQDERRKEMCDLVIEALYGKCNDPGWIERAEKAVTA